MHTSLSLGVSLISTGTDRDTLGVFVGSVAHNGPAERAGIVEGNRIVAIDTVDLHTAGRQARDPALQAQVIDRLRQTLERLKEGVPVNVRVYSDGHVRTVSVKPDKWETVYAGGAADAANANTPVATF